MLKPPSGASVCKTIALALSIATPWQPALARTTYDALVSPSANTSASQTFKTLTDAIASAPADNSPFVIYVKNGVYHERLTITRPNIHLIGESRDGTVITAAIAAGMLKPDGSKWGTYGSNTVKVDAADFSARSLTISNDFDYPGNKSKPDNDPTRLKDSQAVALLVAENSDRAYFHNVSLTGYQDTLYVKGGRSFFSQSRISGTVDFIFGDGTALFDDCDIIARNRTDIKDQPLGYLTAPSTNINQKYGLVFTNSRIVKESQDVPAKSYGLGRPWHPTTSFADGRYADPQAIGQAVFLNTSMDDHIYGWDKMSGKDRQGEKIWFYPQDSRFFEYQSRGAGAEKNDQRPQLSDAEAAEFTAEKVLGGWVPSVPPVK
ncbi:MULTISPECIES: pectinesterase family protein [unclassified Brenneria]|uniref:pectinesterase family protein n=1 Tax=unclassified Brenneria TaxID=2634434 RepID=UPI0015532331|nr:pectinesterase family protein [Brenneria sp. hezel4-2-4]MEE3652738.1 pectinesterase family protein [Brenneria sp. HEZEL_4_2_4]MEE3652847.1 pectinesterase family protein [Brenneria sp. HEZEL_4_2_4]NPD02694.1 pectinesterase A [Brenneria sp. hezel4-2-4]NPD02801.1 pectinesterase A [Brenneria sp. hezel4-2-4]